jgi:hypothetical protein
MRSSFFRLAAALLLTAATFPALAQDRPVPAPSPEPAEPKPAAAAQPAAPAAPTPQSAEPCKGEVAVCVRQIVEQLRKRGWIGMDLALDAEAHLPAVHAVTLGGPADLGGLKAGDLLLGLDGVRHDRKKHEDLEAVETLHRKLAPGDTVTYLVRRDGKEMELDVLLSEAPDDVIATWLGLILYFDHYKDVPAKPAAAAPPSPKPGN